MSKKHLKPAMDYFSRLTAFGLLILLQSAVPAYGAEDIDMSKVRALAALPVREILGDSPVTELSRPSYWKTIRESRVPVVVMFYSNVDAESQRLATLVRYVSVRYKGKLAFYRVMVAAKSKPSKAIAADYEKSYSLDETPGILFYDNDAKKMALEGEHYIEANYKEFRTPSLLLWKFYYDAVCSYIDKNILD